MNDINKRLQGIKEKRANRKNEDKLAEKIEKLAKQREKQQKILQNIESRIQASFEALEKVKVGE